MHFAEGSLMSLMLIALVLAHPGGEGEPGAARIPDRMTQMLAFVDGELAGGAWFAGERFTAADVMMVFPFTTMRRFLEYDLAPYANIAAYLARIEARPAYRKAMALAGPTQTLRMTRTESAASPATLDSCAFRIRSGSLAQQHRVGWRTCFSRASASELR